MESLKQEYQRVLDKISEIDTEISKIVVNPAVQRYINLDEEKEILRYNAERLYYELSFKKYDECNHIFIYYGMQFDSNEEKFKKCNCCLKCGLNNSVLSKDKSKLSIDESIIYDYLKTHNPIRGKYSAITCDLEFAKKIYAEVLANNPDITDQEIIDVLNSYLIPKSNVKFEDNRRLSRVRSNYSKELLY